MVYTYHGTTVTCFTVRKNEDVTLAPGMKKSIDLPSTHGHVKSLEAQGLLKRTDTKKNQPNGDS